MAGLAAGLTKQALMCMPFMLTDAYTLATTLETSHPLSVHAWLSKHGHAALHCARPRQQDQADTTLRAGHALREADAVHQLHGQVGQ